MTEEELKKEAIAKYKTGSYPQLHPDHYAFIHGYLAGAEPREKRIAELEAQLKTVSLKIISCIKAHLCKQDEDYDKAIISPKFLSDVLDQMAADGFEGEIK